MKTLNGIWWNLNTEPASGTLIIDDNNKICLTTYKKLSNCNIVNGFPEGEKITLVDVVLDRTDRYLYKAEVENECDVINNQDLEHSKYRYIAGMAIFGHTYERKGDIKRTNIYA